MIRFLHLIFWCPRTGTDIHYVFGPAGRLVNILTSSHKTDLLLFFVNILCRLYRFCVWKSQMCVWVFFLTYCSSYLPSSGFWGPRIHIGARWTCADIMMYALLQRSGKSSFLIYTRTHVPYVPPYMTCGCCGISVRANQGLVTTLVGYTSDMQLEPCW